MKNWHNILLPSCGVWILLSHRALQCFSWWILFPPHKYQFLVTHIYSLGYYKIVENGYSSKSMNNYNDISTHFTECEYCCPIGILIFFCVFIGPTTPIYICHYSDSVSRQSQNSRNMALAPQMRLSTIMFPPILQSMDTTVP